MSATDPMRRPESRARANRRVAELEALNDKMLATVARLRAERDQAIAESKRLREAATYLDEQLSAMRAERDAARERIERAITALRDRENGPWDRASMTLAALTEGQET